VGDEENRPQKAIPADVKAMIMDTLGGRIQVTWDKGVGRHPYGQLVFFAEFLEVSGLFDAWVEVMRARNHAQNALMQRKRLPFQNRSATSQRRTPAARPALRRTPIYWQ